MNICIDLENGVTEISSDDYCLCLGEGIKEIELEENDAVRTLNDFDYDQAVAKVSQETFDIIDEEFGVN